MKYLKKYNEIMSFVGLQEASNTINDICLELVDNNYKATCRFLVNSNLILDINKLNFSTFNAIEISETLVRVYDYLKTVGYYISSIEMDHNHGEYTVNNFKEFIDLIEDKKSLILSGVHISIKPI